jgi:head-tail adaptor
MAQSGALRERLLVQRRVIATDVMLGRAATYETVDSLPAERIQIRAAEKLQAKALQATVEYRFRTRVRADITEEMRILWTPSFPAGEARKTLEITGVQPDGDGRMTMLLDCVSRPS